MKRDDDQLADEDVELLVELDESSASRSSNQAATEALGNDVHRAAGVLDFINRVREHSPHCVVDLSAESSGDAWLTMDEERPTAIGRFQIRQRLGGGGFGVVFLAFDPELDRELALKVPRVETLISEQTRKRFLKESKTAASLSHPNIATIYEAGTIGPICYIASEHCRGGSLEDFLDHHPDRHLSGRLAAELVATIADAAHHAHERGILHRDIKPTNILLDVDPRELAALHRDPGQLGRVARLVDFGLAKSLDAIGEQTRTGLLIGTPAYTAPEQITGRSSLLDPTADVYSLGATLYECLTGMAPLKKSTEFETLMAAQTEEPPPPSHHVRTVSRDLDAICLCCLQKHPKDRYATAAELAADLRLYLAGKPIQARRVSQLRRLARWYQRNTLITALTVAVAALFVTTGTVLFYSWQQASVQRLQSQVLQRAIDSANSRRIIEEGHQVLRAHRGVTAAAAAEDAMDVSPDSRLLAVGSVSEVQVWDLAAYDLLATLPVAGDFVRFDRAGQYLLAGSTETGIRSWTIDHSEDDQEIRFVIGSPQLIEGGSDRVAMLCQDPEADRWIAMSETGHVGILEPLRSATINWLAEVGAVTDLTVYRNRAALLLPEGSVLIFDTRLSAFIDRLPIDPPGRVAFSPVGNWLAVLDRRSLRLFSANVTELVGELRSSFATHLLAVSADGRLLAVVANGDVIRLVRAANLETVSRLNMREGRSVASVKFSPDGKRLVACSVDGTIDVWDLAWIRRELSASGLELRLPPLASNNRPDDFRNVRVTVQN